MRIPEKLGVPLVVGVFLLAALIWGRNLLDKPRLTEADAQDIAGMDLRVGEATATPEGAMVTAEIENQTRREALSVVFTAEVLDEGGRLLGANPLGNVLNLQPGESRTIEIQVPLPQASEGALTARGKINLVRWKK